MKLHPRLGFVGVLLALSLLPGRAFAALGLEEFHRKPKLILVLVVDQFRADYLTRYQSRFLPADSKNGTVGGYNWLMKRGAYFPFGEYDVLQCMTGPGHAMILSGTYPYQMKISLNYWYNREKGKGEYCTEDADSPLLGVSPEESKKSGQSPKNFTGSTVGDELKNAGYPSRVVAVALKDRASILMAGKRADLALWFEPGPFRWLTSKYYLPDGKLPGWIEKFNAKLATRKDSAYVWESGKDPLGLTTNPEPFRYESKLGDKRTSDWPFGIENTADMAETALEELKLGRGKATDILAVSFSSHDFLGHKLGPNAHEMQEMTVVEDRMVSRILNRVRKTVPGGLKDVVVVLTGDHGVPPLPKWAREQKLDAGEVEGKQLKERMIARLNNKFGKPGDLEWLPFTWDLNYFISPEAIAVRKITREEAEAEVKDELKKAPGVAFVFSRTDYEKRTLPPGMFERQILKSYIPSRNGDVVGIPAPYYINEAAGYPTTHMTSYGYDRTVPIILAGMKIKPGVYPAHADVVDIAPTLSFILGVLRPSASEGRVLHEIF